ncbi:MAG: fructosamine kinase family protein, partial [Rhodothermales bacterium]
MLPPDVASAIELHLDASVVRTQAVGGGCISHATRVDTDRCSVFVKWSRKEAAATFPAEAAGLRALRD